MEEEKRKNEIEHLGRVVGIDEEKITVSIVSQSACISCHSKGSCSVSDIEDKTVEVANRHDRELKLNDTVTIVLNSNLGTIAVLFGYFFPFLVLLFTVIIMLALGFSEGASGLTAIGMLVPYYLILYLTRQRQKQAFNFRLK
jgi:sigma-E factor negative regulatory protein RseC